MDLDEYHYEKDVHDEMLEANGVGYKYRSTLYVDLSKSIEELWHGLHYKSCKYSINKAQKNGLYVREITREEDIKEFAHIHQQQTEAVSHRKGQKKSKYQQEERKYKLCKSLFPHYVLMLQVLKKDDNNNEVAVGSGIFCYGKDLSVFWTGASYTEYLHLCPNELLVWEAMKRLHERGATDFHLGGVAGYKRKYGTTYAYVPRLVFVKYKWLSSMKDIVKRLLKKIYYLT